MTWRTNKRAAQRPKPNLLECVTCDHIHQTHQTSEGHCAFVGCACLSFKPKDWSRQDREIRKRNRLGYFGSRHERLCITDIERAMVRGETDILEIKRQVPLSLGVRAGSNSVYIADALAMLRPGGKFTHRIYEAKGAKTPIYILKRKLVQLLYPHIEFVEIVQ